ncbi:alpha/beta hydrolase [uncultured Psychrosphaera sp.]|uniref:alpha/beta fold hydrolase n=1 Tax=uncultured Psychrosphaera sp. TaxID=1403522 RepID=UPI00260B9C8F|nr:alpha/beta hydrolase [uncultured Psychrosphaera sp.]
MKHKVYLLPGTMCNQRLWHKLFTCAKAEFASKHSSEEQAQFEFVHIPIPANKNFEQLANWLNEYFQEEKVYLLGFSLGGYLASYFAVNYPDRIKGLFIVGNSPCTLTPQEVSQRQALLNFVTDNKYNGLSHKRALQLLDSNNDDQKDVNTIKQMDADLGVDELISQMTYTSERDDLLQAMSVLNIPMTFYYSEQDPLVNVPWLLELKSNNPNCHLVSTSGNGHMLPLEKPQELQQLLKKTLYNMG